MTYNVVEVEEIIQKIRQSYPCLGLECADIGVHISEETDENTLCNDPDVYEPLAGYRPSSDVREVRFSIVNCGSVCIPVFLHLMET
jgi:hypothetical protein